MIRYEFVDENVKLGNIHPTSISQKEREYAFSFIAQIEKAHRDNICPCCGSESHEVFFEKWGVTYNICLDDWSIYMATCINEDTFYQYNTNSELAKYRKSEEYQRIAGEKREEVWTNSAEWVDGRIIRYKGPGKYSLLDWDSRLYGWSEVLQRISSVNKMASFFYDNQGDKDNQSSKTLMFDVICCMDVINRYKNLNQAVKNITRKLKCGGLFIATCRSGSGFDILTLKGNSESIFPLDHVILPSPKGITKLLENHGFQVLELTTPGLLDISYVKSSVEKIEKAMTFERYLLNQTDNNVLQRFQAFLQQNNLSSHMRVVAIKKEEI